MKGSLEQTVWLHLVEWCLKQALLLQLIVFLVIASNSAELGSLLRKEVKVRGALVLDVDSLLALLVIPVFALPLIVFLVVVKVVAKAEVLLSLCLLAVLEGGRKSLEEASNTLQESWPALLHALGHLIGAECEELSDGTDGKLLVVHTSEAVDA